MKTRSKYLIAATILSLFLTSLPAQVLNVTSYGATGNGSTDDTSAIQNAINAVTSGELYFPAGTYRVTSTLNVTGKDIRMRGVGATSIILLDASSDTLLYGSYSSDKGKALILQSIKLSTSGSGNTAIESTYSALQPAHFENGLSAKGLTIAVSGSGTWTYGIKATRNSNVQLTECTFAGQSSSSGTAIYLEEQTINTHISVSTFNGWKKAIELASSGTSSEGLIVDDCSFSSINYGIYSLNSGNTLWVSLTNCSNVEMAVPSGGEPSSIGIYLNNVYDLLVRNNTFTTLTNTSTPSYAIAVNSHRSVIANNAVINSSGTTGTSGIVILASGTDTIIDNNTFENIEGAASIWLQSGAADCKVSNNSFINCAWNISDEGTNTSLYNN